MISNGDESLDDNDNEEERAMMIMMAKKWKFGVDC